MRPSLPWYLPIIWLLFPLAGGAQSAWPDPNERAARVEVPNIPTRTFYVTDFGTLNDTTLDARPGIQAALDSVAGLGGGRVVVPAGFRLHLNGPLHLRPRTQLHLESGSVLKFSDDPSHYLPTVEVRWEGTVAYNHSPLIYANGVEDVALTGEGTIDGNGQKWSRDWRKLQKDDQHALRKMGREGVPVSERRFGEGHYLRPGLVQLYNCRRVLIEGLTFRDSPFWTIHLPFSQDVTCRGLTVLGQTLNDDGIDPDSSRDVLIEDCYIATHDDAISIKAGRDADGRGGPGSRNIVVRNSTLNSGVNAFAIGSELSGGVEDVFVENVRILGGRYGLNVKTNDDRGGAVRNIWIRNVVADTLERAVLRVDKEYKDRRGGGFPTQLDGIRLRNVVARAVLGDKVCTRGLSEAEQHAAFTLENVKVDAGAAELLDAVSTGGRWLTNQALAPDGGSRCDYDLIGGKWRAYERAWHTGQIILSLLKAYELTGDENLLTEAKRAGDWWVSLKMDNGYLLALHGGTMKEERINFTTIADGTPGLYELSRMTGDNKYAATATRAARYALDNLYLPEDKLVYDLVDPQTMRVLREESPFFDGKLSVHEVARPNTEGYLFLDAFRHTGDSTFLDAFLNLCDGLVERQHANGFWMDYHPNNLEKGKIHPRSNTWYAESLLEAYDVTGERKYLEAAYQTGLALREFQRKHGVMFYRNLADGNYDSKSVCGSALSFAGLLWLRLRAAGYDDFDKNLDSVTKWVLNNRFATDHADENLRGAFLETRTYLRSDGLRVYVRDIATSFGIRFLCALHADGATTNMDAE